MRHSIIDADGKVIAACEQKAALGRDTAVDSQVLTVEQPRLWSLEDPYLYRLKSELIVDGEVKDTVIQNFGFRTLRFDCNAGFFLNDVHVKLHGVCQHHDLGALGAAVNKAALKRQLTILKEMGVNSIRTAHNMPAVELMDLADEMGILIVSEAFDMWERKDGIRLRQVLQRVVRKGCGKLDQEGQEPPEHHHVEHRKRDLRHSRR